MPQNTSCLLTLALAVSSALVAMPSQAQTAAETNADITASSQSSITNQNTISKLKKSKAANQNEVINISQLEPSSTTANIQKPLRERIPVYSRIGFGLKQ